MARGKKTCGILKDIRRRIAEANNIEFATSDCRYQGDCPGSCPKCEAEVRYLEEQLTLRRLAGKTVFLAGLTVLSACTERRLRLLRRKLLSKCRHRIR